MDWSLNFQKFVVFIILNLSVADENHGDRFLDFVTVKKGLEDGSLLLIDVRNPKERADSGQIIYHGMYLNISALILNYWIWCF